MYGNKFFIVVVIKRVQPVRAGKIDGRSVQIAAMSILPYPKTLVPVHCEILAIKTIKWEAVRMQSPGRLLKPLKLDRQVECGY